MDNRSIKIIVIGSLAAALLVGFEVYWWIKTTPEIIPLNQTKKVNSQQQVPSSTIKSKNEGLDACKQNHDYALIQKDPQQMQDAKDITDYCYAAVAAGFNDTSLCQKAFNKTNCETQLREFQEAGKQMQESQ